MMFLTAAISPTAAAAVGYGAVIVVLAVLVLIVAAVCRRFSAGRKQPQAAPAGVSAAPAAEAPAAPLAPGAAGELKLHDVDPRTAAILMAIVADKLGKPLNELRFTSIREVK